MFLSALQCAFRRTLAVVLAGTLTATGWAQTAAQPVSPAPEGPKPQRFTVERLHQGPLALSQSDRALPATVRAGA